MAESIRTIQSGFNINCLIILIQYTETFKEISLKIISTDSDITSTI